MMIPSLLENVCEPERLDAEEFANLQTAFKIQSGFIMRAAVKKVWKIFKDHTYRVVFD